jgi:hypothetical protein
VNFTGVTSTDLGLISRIEALAKELYGKGWYLLSPRARQGERALIALANLAHLDEDTPPDRLRHRIDLLADYVWRSEDNDELET